MMISWYEYVCMRDHHIILHRFIMYLCIYRHAMHQIIINEAEIDALQFFTYLVLWNDNMADFSFAKRSSFLDVHACF